MGWLWDNILVDPMVNTLIVLSNLLFGSFGLAIIAFTILIRLITLPLTIKQIRSTRALQSLQPKVQEIQKKYKDPKRRQQEQMKVYKEAGVNPIGCLVPFIIQLPILFALYSTVRSTLGSTPEQLLSLSDRLYPWGYIQHAVPLESTFIGLHLGEPNLIMAILVGVTTWTQQKTTVTTSTDPRTQSTNQILQWMLPLMFTWLAFGFPSGLALYWIVTSIVGTALNIVVFGWGGLNPRAILAPPAKQAPSPETTTEAPVEKPEKRRRPRQEEPAPETETQAPQPAAVDGATDGRPGSKRKKRRRSARPSTPAARPQQGRGRGTGS